MYSINFRGISSEEFGLVASTIGRRSKAEEQVDIMDIPMRSEALVVHNKIYKAYLREVEFVARDRNKISQINTWLDGRGKLRTSLDVGGYFMASVITGLSFEKFMCGIDSFRVGFRVNPFFYLDEGDVPVTLLTSTTLLNPGTIFSEPYLKIKGHGNIALTINNQNCSLTSVSEYIELDSNLKIAYKGTENQGHKMIGDFPVLGVGENHISWTGAVTSIEIIPRWREL